MRVVAAGVVVAEELEGHDRDARRDADDALPIERRRDRPGHVRAVPVVVDVVDGVVVVAEVPAVDVVDVAVAVVVDAVGLLAAARLARVRPRPLGQVRMAEVDPVVDDRDDRARRVPVVMPSAWRPSMSTSGVPPVNGVPCRMSWPVLSRPHSSRQAGSCGRVGLAVALWSTPTCRTCSSAWSVDSVVAAVPERARTRDGRGWRRGRRRSWRRRRRSPRGGERVDVPGRNVTIRPARIVGGRAVPGVPSRPELIERDRVAGWPPGRTRRRSRAR